MNIQAVCLWSAPDLVTGKAIRKDQTVGQCFLETRVPSYRDKEDTATEVSEQWQENESGRGEALAAINHHEE